MRTARWWFNSLDCMNLIPTLNIAKAKPWTGTVMPQSAPDTRVAEKRTGSGDEPSANQFPYKTGDTDISAAPQQVVALPAGTINHHWTKTLVASTDGKKLYVGVGFNSNVGDGLEAENERNAEWEIDPRHGPTPHFRQWAAKPGVLAWQPDTGALWVSVNERDELGDHVPPRLHDSGSGQCLLWISV